MAKKVLPVYEITIEDNSTDGITAISLVDQPAIEVDFIHFNKQLKFAVKDEEQRIVFGPALIANKLIYRRDADGNEFNVKFSTDSVKNIAYSFTLEGKNNNVTLDHQINGNNIKMVETYLAKQDGEGGFEDTKKGDWFTAYQIDDDEIWASVKDGSFNGFSIEIYPTLTKVELQEFCEVKNKNNNKNMAEKTNMFKSLMDNFNSLKGLFSKEETILKLATILEVNKWEINVDQDAFEVGTALTISYEYDGETETYKLTDGEYELEDGRKIQVDSEGVIVLIDGGEASTEEDTTDPVDETEEELKAKAELEAKTKLAEDEETPEEVTIESVQELVINLTQTVADLTVRIETLEGDEAPEETEETEEEMKAKEELAKVELEKVEAEKQIALEKEISELKLKLEELESTTPVAEKVTVQEDLSSKKPLTEFQKWQKLTQK